VRYQTPTSLWSLAFWGLAVAGILAVCVGLVYLMRVAFASFTASPVTAHYPVRPQVFTTPNGMSGWSVRVGPQGQHVPTPAVAGDKVIVGGGFTSCSLYAFDSRHGHPKWTAPLRENGPSAAAVWNDRVAVNTESCTLYLLHTDAGAELWRDTIGPSLTSQPAITDDRVYAASPRGGEYSLTCRRLQDGKEAWSAAIPADLISAPVCHGNRVYFSTYDGGLHCYRATNGRRVWAQQANATSAPYIADGWVYVTTRQNVTAPDGTLVPYEGVCSFDAGLGRPNPRPLWRRRADYLSHDLQSRSPYAQAASAEDAAVGVEERIRDWGETPYVSPYSSPGPSGPRQTWGAPGYAAEMVGLESTSAIWSFEGSRTVVDGNNLYNTLGTIVQCSDRETGDTKWEVPLAGDLAATGGRLGTPPSLAGGKLYVGTTAGEIICINGQDGAILWRYSTGEPIRSQPAVADGRVYVGTTQGTLVCIDTGDPSADGWPMWGGGPGHNGPTSKGAVARTANPPA
jgi:outer membrane protein assembly factor BamB